MCYNGYCQREGEEKNVIMINTIGIFGRLFDASVYSNSLSYERAFNNKLSWLIEVDQGKYFSATEALGYAIQKEIKYTGFGITPEIRFYRETKKTVSPKGVFMGIYFRYLFLREKYSEIASQYTLKEISNEKGWAYGIGFNVGYKFGKQNFLFEPLIGYAFGPISDFSNDPRIDPYFKLGDSDLLFLRLAFKIGFRF